MGKNEEKRKVQIVSVLNAMEATSNIRLHDYRESDWPKGLYRRGVFYRFKRMVNGRHYCEVFGSVSHDEAVRRATRFSFDIADGKEPGTKDVRQQTSFRHFAYDVWLPQKKTEIRAGSFTRYRSVVDNFAYYLEKVKGITDCPLSAITYSTASDYIVHRSQAPLMPNGSRKFTRFFKNGAAKATLNAEKAIFLQLFKEACRRKVIEVNPFEGVVAKRPTQAERYAKRRPLSVDEAKALLTASAVVANSTHPENARFDAIAEFLLKTGERENEMVILEWSDVDWDADVIHVCQKTVTERRCVPIPPKATQRIEELISNRTPDDPLFRTEQELVGFGSLLDIREKGSLMNIKVGEVDLSKGLITATCTFVWKPKGSSGDVPMCNSVRRLLRRLQETSKSNFVFAHHDGGRCRLRLLEMLKKAQRLADIKGNLRVHDLRHTCAVRLRENGVPLEAIMGILRHADIRETLLYAPYKVDEGKRAIQYLDEPDTSAEAAEGKIRENLAGKQGCLVGIGRE